MEPRRARQVPTLLLVLVFYLLQAVFSTTVIPSCIPGESGDNCTALVQTEDNPRVAQVSITKCSADMNGYCLHGQCIYLVDMSENYCRCEVGYTGVRCEHFFLTVQKPLSKEYVALTVILVILFLVIVAGSIYYFCRWYRNRKSKEPKKEYERVTSGDPALPQVWIVPLSLWAGMHCMPGYVNIPILLIIFMWGHMLSQQWCIFSYAKKSFYFCFIFNRLLMYNVHKIFNIKGKWIFL